MPRTRKTERPIPRLVDFDFGDRTYQLDLSKQKVYRRFVEIESAKAFEILTTWRSQHATA